GGFFCSQRGAALAGAPHVVGCSHWRCVLIQRGGNFRSPFPPIGSSNSSSPEHAVALKGKASDQAEIELFLDMIAAERGGAKNSLAAYARDLADLSAYLARTKRRLLEASNTELRSYLASLAGRGLAAASVAPRLSVLRQYYR